MSSGGQSLRRQDEDLDPFPTILSIANTEAATKTYKYGRMLAVRSEFMFSCTTVVQCIVDGGCCKLGDYCTIKNGALGCCPVLVFAPDLAHPEPALTVLRTVSLTSTAMETLVNVAAGLTLGNADIEYTSSSSSTSMTTGSSKTTGSSTATQPTMATHSSNEAMEGREDGWRGEAMVSIGGVGVFLAFIVQILLLRSTDKRDLRAMHCATTSVVRDAGNGIFCGASSAYCCRWSA